MRSNFTKLLKIENAKYVNYVILKQACQTQTTSLAEKALIIAKGAAKVL
jgi:hypothetical protein